MSGIEGLIKQGNLILTKGVVKPLIHHGWQRPSEARGATWTLSFWLRAAAGIYLLCAEPAAAFLFLLGWMLARHLGSKPKRHTKQIPYRRRRH